MAYTMRTDEILEALQRANHPAAADMQRQLEALTAAMAGALAAQHGIERGEATFEGVAFAGTCCTFKPGHEGQPLPECMEGYDAPSEWGEC